MLGRLYRKKTAKKVWIILAIMIIPAFAFWGFGTAIRGPQEKGFAGFIAGRKIPFSEFREAVSAVRNQLLMRFGDNFSQIEPYVNLPGQAWERLILLEEAKTRRISASDREVISSIENNPNFAKNGQFDQRLYNQLLQYALHSPARAFEEQVRQNLIIGKLYTEVTKNITLSPEELWQAYRRENEAVNINYIAAVPAQFEKDITLSEEELKEYFNQNVELFRRSLSFNLEYLGLDSAEKVNSLLNGLNQNTDLAQLAKQLNTPLKETGLFPQAGPIPQLGWPAELLNLLPAANTGELFRPLLIDKTYYLIKVKERKPAYLPDFAEARKEIELKLSKEKARFKAKLAMENCLQKLSADQTQDLAKLASESGLKYAAADKLKFAAYIEGIGMSDNFWLQAAELKEGEISGILEEPSGFYLFRLNKRLPPEENRFETEKKALSEKLTLQKKEEFFARYAGELQKNAALNLP
jgi:peptidyl-prolyl cis-trans isomerase D